MIDAPQQDQPGDVSPTTPAPATPPAAQEPPPGPFVARADRVFRLKRGVIVLLLVGYGLWSAWDGFFTWPRETAEFERIERQLEMVEPGGAQAVALREEQKQYTKHTPTDILFNRVMALLLPPLGLLLLARSLYVSRGEIRLAEDGTLHAPGHDPIPLSAIKRLDDALWQRKGIAYVEYESPQGAQRVRLDHDPYEPKAIRAIHDRLALLVAGKVVGSAD